MYSLCWFLPGEVRVVLLNNPVPDCIIWLLSATQQNRFSFFRFLLFTTKQTVTWKKDPTSRWWRRSRTPRRSRARSPPCGVKSAGTVVHHCTPEEAALYPAGGGAQLPVTSGGAPSIAEESTNRPVCPAVEQVSVGALTVYFCVLCLWVCVEAVVWGNCWVIQYESKKVVWDVCYFEESESRMNEDCHLGLLS